MPAILDRFPRLKIALLPTPLQDLSRLRTVLGTRAPQILMKRDDLTGLALGGNKSRKLEFLLADARAKGADTVITCGAAQSNHALQTAAACREYGMEIRCVLYGSRPTQDSEKTGNLLLHGMLDTPIRWVQMTGGEVRREQALRRGMQEEAQAMESDGRRVYAIPTGGSTSIGALGYLQAVLELREQLESDEANRVRALMFASGSGGTHAGMVVGARLAKWPVQCVGVEIDPIPADANGISPFHRAIASLAGDTSRLLGFELDISPDEIHLESRFSGPAYGAETGEATEAARLLFRTEGILLDPVYTAKAFAALLARIEAGAFEPADTVLFWHTGGAAGIFARH